ncbi:MAG: hypothetical protein K6T61_13485 [Bryobacteraceae bacterium]|nr:hypothetical protein [Bryobacteraceae bacterium]
MRSYIPLTLLILISACGPTEPPRTSEKTPESPPRLKITHFYAGKTEIIRGESVLLCYGVENAAEVRLDPPAESLSPGYHRCFTVSPERDTTYRLTARDRYGHSAYADVNVAVKSPAPAAAPKPEPALIRMFVAASPEVPAGFPVTLCYSAPEAESISIDPPVQELKPAQRFCFRAPVHDATTFRLTARAPGGRMETAEVTVRVR